MTHELRLGLDLDGVFADFNGDRGRHGFAQTLIDVTGRDLLPTPFVPHTWDWMGDAGYRPSEIRAAWDAVHGDPTWWTRLSPYPHAEGILQAIHDWSDPRGDVPFTPVFLTSRHSPGARAQSAQWLQHYGFPGVHVICTDHAYHKGQLVSALRVDVFVDDHLENHAEVRVQAHAKGPTQLLIDQPYNQQGAPGATRIPLWQLSSALAAIRAGHRG